MAANERSYYQRRAPQEIDWAMRADVIEAEIAHSTMASLLLQRCVSCAAGRTAECSGCLLSHVCEYNDRGTNRLGVMAAIAF